MSNHNKKDLEDALARLAAGYDADAEQGRESDPSEVSEPPTPSTPARPAQPIRPAQPTRSAQPAPGKVRPASPAGGTPPGRMPQQRPVVPPGALPSARNLAGAAAPVESGSLADHAGNKASDSAPESAASAELASYTEPEPPIASVGFSPPARRRPRVNPAIDFKRTMIPVDLVGGLMLIALGAWHFVADKMSILGSIPTKFMLLLPLLGLGLIGLGIWNMAKVRAAMAALEAP